MARGRWRTTPYDSWQGGTTLNVEKDLPILAFPSQEAFEAWLADHHGSSRGLWLKIAKKGAGGDSVTYAEAVEAALCYGWIDSQKDRFDEQYSLQRFTPRGPRSKWSKINREKATDLINQGRMQPAGMHEVERAQADGRWDAAYDGQRTTTIPPDLQAALDENERAAAFWPTLSSANRYAILYRLQEAKRPETRARRLEKFIAMLNEGKTIH